MAARVQRRVMGGSTNPITINRPADYTGVSFSEGAEKSKKKMKRANTVANMDVPHHLKAALLSPSTTPTDSQADRSVASFAVQCNLSSDESSSDEETCRVPSWRHLLRQFCQYTFGSLRICPCVRKRIRNDSVGSSSSSTSSDTTDEEEERLLRRKAEKDMRAKLKFHFMNPFEKWRYKKRRRFPVKLVLQVLSVILVTTQIILYGQKKSQLTHFITGNKETIENLFLGQDNMTVYTLDDLISQLAHVADTYYNLKSIALAPYDYSMNTPQHPAPVLWVEILEYENISVDPSEHKISVSSQERHVKFPVYPTRNDSCITNCTYESIFKVYVNQDTITKIKTITIPFRLTSFYIDQLETLYVSCVTFDIKILFKNDINNGLIPITVAVDTTMSSCEEKNEHFVGEVLRQFVVLDIFVLLVVSTYTLLSVKSIITSASLTRQASKFFQTNYGHKLSWRQKLSLQNLWFYGVVFGNLLVVIGTIIKISIAFKIVLSINLEDITTIILGLAVFFQWCGLLRFLSYFDTYNILLLTLKLSIPSVLRFAVCAGVLYVAFLLLGWLILGPYHEKFTDLTITSECLFSLLNGDDMFATYKEMPTTPVAVWIFSKVYLYIFISLFIYVVLSVFIGLISDTYETLNEHWYSRSKGFLHEFALGGMARWKRKRRALRRMRPTFQEVQEVHTSEGFILVDQDNEETTDNDNNGNDNGSNDSNRHNHNHVRSPMRNYGSFSDADETVGLLSDIESLSSSFPNPKQQRKTAPARVKKPLVHTVSMQEEVPERSPELVPLGTLPPQLRQRSGSWPTLLTIEEGVNFSIN